MRKKSNFNKIVKRETVEEREGHEKQKPEKHRKSARPTGAAPEPASNTIAILATYDDAPCE